MASVGTIARTKLDGGMGIELVSHEAGKPKLASTASAAAES